MPQKCSNDSLNCHEIFMSLRLFRIWAFLNVQKVISLCFRRYMEFFCGSGPECQTATNQADEETYKTRMLEKVTLFNTRF